MDPFVKNKVLWSHKRSICERLLIDLAKYLLAEDSGDDLRHMDYSDVCLDVVVSQGVAGLELLWEPHRTQAGQSWRHLLCSVIAKD